METSRSIGCSIPCLNNIESVFCQYWEERESVRVLVADWQFIGIVTGGWTGATRDTQLIRDFILICGAADYWSINWE